MHIVEVSVKNMGDRKKYLEDTDIGHKYRRINAGFAWPAAGKDGFIVVMAEDLNQDFSKEYNPRHFKVLAEFESPNLENLHRQCLKFRKDFLCGSILGKSESSFIKIWRQFREHPGLSMPYEDLDLKLFNQLLLKNTNRGTLHFQANSLLPKYLIQLTHEDLKNNEIEDFPPVAALGYVLCEMDFHAPYPIFRPKRNVKYRKA